MEPGAHSLKNKTALVTGGGRGLGRAMVLGLAQAGAQVVATSAREVHEVEETAREARALCGEDRVLPLSADVTHEEDCVRTLEATLKHFGHLDILVNNAGRGMKYVRSTFMTEPTRFWEVELETWRMVIDTNVNGPVLMARLAAPGMVKAGWGRIINVSMNRETMARRGFSPYGPSKAALESETVIWSQDLEDTGVTVNALLPGGATFTGMIPGPVPDDIRAHLLDPAIIVPPLLWLASPESDGITGHRLVATKWRCELSSWEAAKMALEPAGWGVRC
jgi:3-oxoacyl-[acyl-carrier protein] reductase